MSNEVRYGNYTEWQNDIGQPHRDEFEGPAFIHDDGTMCFYNNGIFHRTAGPAVIHANGGVEYWVEGKRHRLDGPACIWADGTTETWVNNIKVNSSVPV